MFFSKSAVPIEKIIDKKMNLDYRYLKLDFTQIIFTLVDAFVAQNIKNFFPSNIV